MKYKLYKILFTIFFALVLGLILMTNQANAVDTLISPYPTINGLTVGFGMTLPDMIKYIYLFALGISGAVALTSLLIGAIRYISAAGNSSKMSDAKDQIFSALLGVVILLSSYLILNTINPDLVNFSLNTNDLRVNMITNQANTTVGPTYSCSYCCGLIRANNRCDQPNRSPSNFSTCLPFGNFGDANSYCARLSTCPSGYVPISAVTLCSQ